MSFRECTVPSYCWVVLHSVDISQFVSSAIELNDSMLSIPILGDYDESCYKHSPYSFLWNVNTHFSWVNI